METNTKEYDGHKTVTTFIDMNEIEEMLGEYYDFLSISAGQWMALDNQIRKMCEERGVSSDYSEEYVRICDICCEKLHFPQIE